MWSRSWLIICMAASTSIHSVSSFLVLMIKSFDVERFVRNFNVTSQDFLAKSSFVCFSTSCSRSTPSPLQKTLSWHNKPLSFLRSRKLWKLQNSTYLFPDTPNRSSLFGLYLTRIAVPKLQISSRALIQNASSELNVGAQTPRNP